MKTELLNSKPSTAEMMYGGGFVLVVDDEEQNRMLLCDTLEARGYEVAQAEDGEQAMQKVAERAPDTILLDVMMPRMDGFEVCRRLKSDGKTAPIPILMVTALSERKERMIGIAAGANDFLNKPIDIQDTTLRVRNAVYTKRLFDQLKAEREKSDQLLLNILPGAIADRMKKGEVNIAEHHPDVTVLLADLVGFSSLAAQVGPEQVVCLLNEIFSGFDTLVEQHGLEKIKTIGDGYMVAGGLTSPKAGDAEAVAELALALRKEIERLDSEYATSIRIRMGISAGPVIGGVIGRKKFSYDLWGDTVNLACRLEAIGQPGSITVAEAAYERLKDKFRFKPTRVEVKGYGAVTAYELYSRV